MVKGKIRKTKAEQVKWLKVRLAGVLFDVNKVINGVMSLSRDHGDAVHVMRDVKNAAPACRGNLGSLSVWLSIQCG